MLMVCYLVFCAYVRDARCLGTLHPLYMYILHILGGGVRGKRWGYHQYGASSFVGSNGKSFDCSFGFAPL